MKARRAAMALVPAGLCALSALSAWSNLGHARERAGSPDEPASPPSQPPTVIVVGFQDEPGSAHCDPDEARLGRCAERVGLLELKPNSPSVSALWRQVGWLYARLWEDLSLRWSADDGAGSALRTGGADALPPHGTAWGGQRYARAERRDAVYGVPAAPLWRGASGWWEDPSSDAARARTGSTCAPASVFCSVRYASPAWREELVTSDPPAMVVLRGRFAERLASARGPLQADLLDADPSFASPFYEQLYPYEGIGSPSAVSRETRILEAFRVPAELLVGGPEVGEEARSHLLADRLAPWETAGPSEVPLLESGADLVAAAHVQQSRLQNTIGLQVLRFARGSYAPVHIRVFLALTAMGSPPGATNSGGLGAYVPVAATQGELDLPVEAQPPGSGGLHRSTLDVSELPNDLIAWAIPQVLREIPEEVSRLELAKKITADVAASYPEYVVDQDAEPRKPLTALDVADLRTWALANHTPGHGADLIESVARVALAKMLVELDRLASLVESEKREDLAPLIGRADALRSLLLMRQMMGELRAGLPAPGTLASPGALESAAMATWDRVLKGHGPAPARRPGGQGEVDPVAICTTRDKAEALDEPSFGQVDLELLVSTRTAVPEAAGQRLKDEAEADRAKRVTAFLWDARDQLPFMALDDPALNTPLLDEILALPSGERVVRVRWTVWTGWHTLWSAAPVQDARGTDRLALRVAPICADTTLASPSLVPSLLRAALSQDLWPSTPDYTRDSQSPPPKGGTAPHTSDEARVDQTTAAATEVEDRSSKAPSQVDAARTSPDGALQTGGAKATSALSNLEGTGDLVTWIASPCATLDGAAWLRCVMRPAIARLASAPGGLLVLTLDATSPRPTRPTRDQRKDEALRAEIAEHRIRLREGRARAPYTRRASRLGHGERMQISAWGWYVDPSADDGPRWSLVWPELIPNGAVAARDPKARWRRKGSLDWTFDGGLGGFPVRVSEYACAEQTQDDLLDCSSLGVDEGTSRLTGSSGISADLGALLTVWMPSSHRWALELGPEIRMDLVPPGGEAIWNNAIKTDSGWPDETDDEVSVGAPSYTWTPYPQAGLVLGAWFAPPVGQAPFTRQRWRGVPAGSSWSPWGAPQPDGSDRVGRMQAGVRTGALIGLNDEGTTFEVLGELWAGWSIFRPRSPYASFLPYHPSTLVGPFARVQYGMTPWPNDDLHYLTSVDRWTVVIGARGQLRLGKKPDAVESR